MKQEYLGLQSANYVQDSCRTLCVDSQSPITQKKPDNGRQRRIWNQILLIIPSSPSAHFLPFKPHIHDINSVEKEVRECVMWTEQLVDSIFHFQPIALLSDTASVQSFSSRGKVPFQQFKLLFSFPLLKLTHLWLKEIYNQHILTQRTMQFTS